MHLSRKLISIFVFQFGGCNWLHFTICYRPFSYCIDLSAIWTGWAIYQNLPTRSNRKRVLPWPKLSTNADVWDESQRKLSEIQLIWTSELLTNMRKIFLTYICNKTIKFTINDCVVIRYAVRMQFLNCETLQNSATLHVTMFNVDLPFASVFFPLRE